jgi:hypothetical protein
MISRIVYDESNRLLDSSLPARHVSVFRAAPRPFRRHFPTAFSDSYGFSVSLCDEGIGRRKNLNSRSNDERAQPYKMDFTVDYCTEGRADSLFK